MAIHCAIAVAQPPADAATADYESDAGKLAASVQIVQVVDGSDRLFVVDPVGMIRIIEDGVTLTTPFLDLTSDVAAYDLDSAQRGLVGMAFHPDFVSNGRFYVDYVRQRADDAYEPCVDNAAGCVEEVIAEFTVSENPDIADADGAIVTIIDATTAARRAAGNEYGPDDILSLALVASAVDHAAFVDCLQGPNVPLDANGFNTVNVSVGPGTSFSPANVTIEIGDTVHWFWGGGFHNVESGMGGVHDGNFRSGNATSSTATTFDVTFDEAFLSANPMPDNVYPYYCVVHQGLGMVGSVTVQPNGCTVFDTDSDGDVDLRDWSALQGSLNLIP